MGGSRNFKVYSRFLHFPLRPPSAHACWGYLRFEVSVFPQPFSTATYSSTVTHTLHCYGAFHSLLCSVSAHEFVFGLWLWRYCTHIQSNVCKSASRLNIVLTFMTLFDWFIAETRVKTIGGETDVTPICTNSTLTVITVIICKIRTERSKEECRLLYQHERGFEHQCDSRFTLMTENQTVFLHLTALTPVDSGNYTCQCSAPNGTFILNLNITVEGTCLIHFHPLFDFHLSVILTQFKEYYHKMPLLI